MSIFFDRPAQSSKESTAAQAKIARDSALSDYNINKTSENKSRLDAAEAALDKAQKSVGGSDDDVDRKDVTDSGEGDTPEESPETVQTADSEDGESSEPEADPDAAPFIYSDVNMHYILDKRHIPFRTTDGVFHTFFLESYKSIEAWQQTLADSEDGTTGTKFDGMQIKVLRNSGGNTNKEEIIYTVTNPPEFDDDDEDNIVDSILWAYTSYKEGITALASTPVAAEGEDQDAIVEDQVVPILQAGNTGGFLFPVFVADPTENTLVPLTNIKYPNIVYNPMVNFIDMTFWSNYRITSDGSTISHPFTRQRDLRNVGRALMFTTGWYDKAKIVYNSRTYYRNVFVFSPPKQIFTPGLGGEFDVDRIEPVVDSVPMGLKFVEFST